MSRADEAKPIDWTAFIQWAAANGVDIENGDKTRRHFESSQVLLQNTLRSNPFFTRLPDELEQAEAQYRSARSTPLFMEGSLSTFTLNTKSYTSTTDKAYRLNVAWNDRWPKPPSSRGWVTPSNWHRELDDLLRTTLVCKYLDGPAYTCARLKALSTELGLQGDFSPRQLDDGYYAYHFYLTASVDFPDYNWEMQQCDMKVEIQVTTQLQELARTLTHESYAGYRSQTKRDRDLWKWDYRTDRFRAGYIAHTLHLVEGLINEMRDRHTDTRLNDVRTTPKPEGQRND